jgi:pilus assembly protein TadC
MTVVVVVVVGVWGAVMAASCVTVAIGLAHSRVTKKDVYVKVIPSGLFVGALVVMITYAFASSL